MPITIDSFNLSQEQKEKLVHVSIAQALDPKFIQDGLGCPGFWLVDKRPSGRVISELLVAGDFPVQNALVEEQVNDQPLVEEPKQEVLIEQPKVEELLEQPKVEPLVEAPVTAPEASQAHTLTEGTTTPAEPVVEATKKRGGRKPKEQ